MKSGALCVIIILEQKKQALLVDNWGSKTVTSVIQMLVLLAAYCPQGKYIENTLPHVCVHVQGVYKVIGLVCLSNQEIGKSRVY